MTVKIIPWLQAFSSAIRPTFVQYFTRFQLTGCSRGLAATGGLLVASHVFHLHVLFYAFFIKAHSLLSSSQTDSMETMLDCLDDEERLSELFCVVFCPNMHTLVLLTNSSCSWVFVCTCTAVLTVCIFVCLCFSRRPICCSLSLVVSYKCSRLL